MKRLYCMFALFALVGTSACLRGLEEGGPTEPEPIFQDSSQIFAGTLSPQGTRFQAFSLDFQADTKISLASLMVGSMPVSVPVTLALGTLSADTTTCTATSTQTVTPSLTTHIAQTLVTGTYCVSVTDAGSLSGDTTFAVRIRKTLANLNFGTPGTQTLSTNLYPGGTVNRTFGATANGEARVVLTAVSPLATLGLGIGVTDDSVADCFLNRVVTNAGPGTQLTANVELGPYCVKVFDPGGLQERVNFTVEITRP